MTGPQDYILQHLHEPEAGPEGGIKRTNNVFHRASMLTEFPKFMFTASKLWMPGPQDCIFQHLHEAEACLEGWYQKVPIMFFIQPVC